MDFLQDIADGIAEEPVEQVVEAQELTADAADTETPTVPEDSNALQEAAKIIGKESESHDAVFEEVFRGVDPRPSSSSTMHETRPILLNNWPLDLLSEQEQNRGIIPLLQDGGECLNVFRETEGLTPRDFMLLEFSDNKLLSIAVAMLWGWLPANRKCHVCSSPMRLYQREGLKDYVTWRCTQEVPLPQWSKRGLKDRRRCFAEVTPRSGTWLVAINAPIEVVMHAIFCGVHSS